MSRLSRLASIAKLAIDSLRSEHRSAQARKEQKLRAFVDAAKRGLDSRRSALAFRGLDDLREGPPPIMGADEDPEVELEYEDEDEEPVDDGYTDVELLGRSAAYHPDAWEEIERSQIRVVESSNVYSYAYESEPGKRGGILYVTFLNWEPGMGQGERSGPGPTYAYYDFPEAKYRAFQSQAAASAGRAVWDFCRVRHTVHEHQHRYELVQVGGDYIPRRATAKGFATRHLISPGLTPEVRKKIGRRLKALKQAQKNNPNARDAYVDRMVRRSTLAPRQWLPNRGTPNRGTPNRGN